MPEPRVTTASAPGRVNLMGEHTDYNGGLVLPMAIPQRTHATIRPNEDKLVTVVSTEYPGRTTTYRMWEEKPTKTWIDYIQGLTYILRMTGHQLTGFHLELDSTVPMGSGLSSSAALEVSVLRALRAAFDLPLTDVDIARIGHRAETEFVGAPVGMMDQMASSLANETTALFLNTRELTYEMVPLPSNLEVVIINSGVSHHHASGGYRQRRNECDEAVKLLGVKYLTDLSPRDLPRTLDLPLILPRRVRHVVMENARVISTKDALINGDEKRLDELFRASHDSQRDDYEVSVPEIDLLVDAARRDEDIIAARLTGGGFGGSMVMLARKSRGYAAAQRVIHEATREHRFTPHLILPVKPAG